MFILKLSYAHISLLYFAAANQCSHLFFLLFIINISPFEICLGYLSAAKTPINKSPNKYLHSFQVEKYLLLMMFLKYLQCKSNSVHILLKCNNNSCILLHKNFKIILYDGGFFVVPFLMLILVF